MKAARTGPNAFTLEFESEDELREEHRANLSQGGLRLPVADRPALFSPADVKLRGPSGREARVKGTVVAPLADGVALSFEGDADALLASLLAAPLLAASSRSPEPWRFKAALESGGVLTPAGRALVRRTPRAPPLS